MMKSLLRKKSQPSGCYMVSNTTQTTDMNESEACHGGYLEKRQGVRSTKKLWFQLNGRELNYYKSNPAREPQSPKGSINLDGVQTVKRTSTQTHHFVQITTAKDTLRLKAESASACDEWVSKLHDAMRRRSIVYLNPPDTQTPPIVRGKSSHRGIKPLSIVTEDQEACRQSKQPEETPDYDLMQSPTEKESDDNNELYEMVQAVEEKREPALTDTSGTVFKVTAPPRSSVEIDTEKDDPLASTHVQPRNSISSGYGTETNEPEGEGESAYEVVTSPTPMPTPKPRQNSSRPIPSPRKNKPKYSAIKELRRALVDLGVNIPAVNAETSSNGEGVQEMKEFLNTRFVMTV